MAAAAPLIRGSVVAEWLHSGMWTQCLGPSACGVSRRVRRRVKGNKVSTAVPWPGLLFIHHLPCSLERPGPEQGQHKDWQLGAGHVDLWALEHLQTASPFTKGGVGSSGGPPESGAEARAKVHTQTGAGPWARCRRGLKGEVPQLLAVRL